MCGGERSFHFECVEISSTDASSLRDHLDVIAAFVFSRLFLDGLAMELSFSARISVELLYVELLEQLNSVESNETRVL